MFPIELGFSTLGSMFNIISVLEYEKSLSLRISESQMK